MFLIFTKDMFFLNAMLHILKRHKVIHITSEEQLCEQYHKGAKAIVDTYDNNIFHTSIGLKLKKLKLTHALVISPFAIKKCVGNTPTVFCDRRQSVIEFLHSIERRSYTLNSKTISFSHKQHLILTLIMREIPGEEISELLNISRKTFYSHKYNIMLLLKLRKMCELVNLHISHYLR